MTTDDDLSDRTLYCSNLPDRITEELLFELFLQAGPVDSVRIPKDKDGRFRKFGFVEFKHKVSVPYAIGLMEGTRLFGSEVQIKPRHGSSFESPQQREPQFHKSMSAPNMAENNAPWPWINDQNRFAGSPLLMATQAMATQVAMQHGFIGNLQRADTSPVPPLMFNQSHDRTPQNYGYGNRNSSGSHTPDSFREDHHRGSSNSSHHQQTQSRHHRRDHSEDRNRHQYDHHHQHHHTSRSSHNRHGGYHRPY